MRPGTLCAMFARPLLFSLSMSCLAAISLPSGAEDIRNLQVTEEHGRYTVSFDAVLNVPVGTARPFMTEPANWPRLSEIITDAVVVEQLGDGGQKVHVSFSACVLFFCKSIRKVEEMRREANGDIVTLALPEESDFDYARERWRIDGDHRHTHVSYEAELVPSFYVPPLIGPYILKTKLQTLLTQTAQNLEGLTP